MAVINAEISAVANAKDTLIAFWETLTEGDSGSAVQDGDFSDRSVQVVGTFGGETFVIQGSNDGTNWHTLYDLQGSLLSFSAAGLKGVAECTRYIRPLGDGNGTATDVDVHLYAKR